MVRRDEHPRVMVSSHRKAWRPAAAQACEPNAHAIDATGEASGAEGNGTPPSEPHVIRRLSYLGGQLVVFDSYEAILYTLLLLMPGLICDRVLASVIVRRQEDEYNALRFLGRSCLCYLWMSPLVWFLVRQQDLFRDPWWLEPGTWLFVAVIWPAAFGVLLARWHQANMWQRILASLGIRAKHATATAWDHVFGPEERVLLVQLEDDTQIAGMWAEQSLASSDPAERDLYLDVTYRIGEDGILEVPEEQTGTWIPHARIKQIQLRKAPTDGGDRECRAGSSAISNSGILRKTLARFGSWIPSARRPSTRGATSRRGRREGP